MSYRREVENLLGRECIDKLLNHVRGGRMSADQLKYFVEHLGELSNIDPNVLYGNHMRRMNQGKDRPYVIELLEVLSDWYNVSLCEMTQDQAMSILVRALSQPEVSCQLLAKQLSKVDLKVLKIWLSSSFRCACILNTIEHY